MFSYLGAVTDDKLTPSSPEKQVITPNRSGILEKLKLLIF